MVRPTFFSLVLAIACNGDDDTTPVDGTIDGDADTDTDTDSDSDTDVDCDITIASVDPPNNADLVKLDNEVVVSFSGPVTSDAPWSVDVTGASGTATLAADSASATWTPAGGMLPPETMITVDAAVCNDTASSSFMTLPSPIDVADASNRTFVLDWADVSIDEPPGAFLFEDEITIELVLLEFLAVDPLTLDVESAAAIGEDVAGTPAPFCTSAVEGVASFDLNPYFTFGPETFTFVIDESAGTTSQAEDLTMIARVVPGGAMLTDVRVSTLLATEDLSPGDTCAELAPLLQGTCLPCSVSYTGECLFVEGTAPSAALAPPGVDIIGTCGL